MSTQTKKVWKIVGISLGALLIIGGTVLFFVWRSRKKDEEIGDENPYVTQKSTGGGGSVAPPSNSGSTTVYSKDDIKKMQVWLSTKAALFLNSTIYNAIKDTGGIDGVIGPGFNKALSEAIKEGWVTGISDLYRKSQSITPK